MKPRGKLLVVDSHPLAMMLGEGTPIETAKLKYPYFRSQATRWAEEGSYACTNVQTQANECFEWTHRLGQIVNAAIRAGLAIEALDEHAEGYWAQFLGQELSEDGHYRLPAQSEGKVPLCFSLLARKR